MTFILDFFKGILDSLLEKLFKKLLRKYILKLAKHYEIPADEDLDALMDKIEENIATDIFEELDRRF